jgi:DNA-binding GntR family transcriptional regulator
MIAREGEAARWREVADAIRARIHSGELGPGVVLPSEVALGQEHDVGRTTIRKAIDDLRAEGLVFVVHGSGTFVREVHDMTRLKLTRPYRLRVRMPTREERAQLGLHQGVPVFEVVRRGRVELFAGDRYELIEE